VQPKSALKGGAGGGSGSGGAGGGGVAAAAAPTVPGPQAYRDSCGGASMIAAVASEDWVQWRAAMGMREQVRI
jgi:hypothetical protein